MNVDPIKILDALKECTFEELSEDSCTVDIFDACDIDFFADDFRIGATKFVLYPREGDYVVKIPFTHDSYNYNGEVIPFERAQEPNGWDYCKAETIYFENAIVDGVDFAFLKTECIGFTGDWHPIYVQPQAEMLAERRSSHPKDWKSTAHAAQYCCENHHRCFDEYWIADFIECYDEQTLETLYDFLDAFAITDLHEGNLGYYEGKPVIVDYAGYWEDC